MRRSCCVVGVIGLVGLVSVNASAASAGRGLPGSLGAKGPTLSIFAGKIGHSGTPKAGRATRVSLAGPAAVAVDAAGDLYIADNYVVERVTPSGHLTIVAGKPGKGGQPTPGPATKSRLGFLEGVAVDQHGALYLADSVNSVIEKVTAQGKLSVVAGKVGKSGEAVPGQATHSRLGDVQGVAVDAKSDIFIADGGSDFGGNSVVEKVTPGGKLSIVAGKVGKTGPPVAGKATHSRLGDLTGVATGPHGSLYIADGGQDTVSDNGVVEKVNSAGTLSVVAGIVGKTGTPVKGKATKSPLDFPQGVTVDAKGNLYLADSDQEAGGNCAVEKVNTAGQLSIVAGQPNDCGAAKPGPASKSKLDPVGDVAVDKKGNVFIADYYSFVVEKVAP